MTTPEILLTCPSCQQPNFTKRGLASHQKSGHCKKSTENLMSKAITLQPVSQPVIEVRLTRIGAYHKAACAVGWHLKLIAFLAGLELKCLRDDLGIAAGRPKKNSETVSELNPETVSEVLKGRSWEDFIEESCGFTARTGRNYITAYDNIYQACPKLAERIVAAAHPKIADAKGQLIKDVQPLALQDALALVPEKDLQAFCDAVDGWELNELYQRPESAAKKAAAAKDAADKNKNELRQAAFTFWFDDFAKRAGDKTYLRLPLSHRRQLLEKTEILVAELKASLKGGAK